MKKIEAKNQKRQDDQIAGVNSHANPWKSISQVSAFFVPLMSYRIIRGLQFTSGKGEVLFVYY